MTKRNQISTSNNTVVKKSAVKKAQPLKADSSFKQLSKKPAQSRLTAEQRERMIAEAAYYLAEQRGFQGDESLADWLRAEVEIDSRLSSKV